MPHVIQVRQHRAVIALSVLVLSRFIIYVFFGVKFNITGRPYQDGFGCVVYEWTERAIDHRMNTMMVYWLGIKAQTLIFDTIIKYAIRHIPIKQKGPPLTCDVVLFV